MKKIIILYLFFSLTMKGQVVEQILFEGKLKIEGNFLKGKLSFFANVEDGNLDGLSIVARMSFVKMENTISQEELELSLLKKFSIKKSSSNVLMDIQPSFFTNDGGVLELKIFLENEVLEERILIKKIDNKFIALRILFNDETEKIEHINFLLRGSMFKISQLKLKTYTVNP